LQFADFINAVKTGGATLVDCREGLKPVKIITSIYESAESGREVYLK